MKIIFICSSLEPRCDGVGDYVRRLAGELIRQGHDAAAVAINDHQLKEPLKGTQTSGEVDLQILRLPAQMDSSERFRRASEWIGDLNPDWLSLQFVPFSFNQKGLTFGLGKKLKELGNQRNWHIMFHELWVVTDYTASFKHIFLGNIQKRLIKSLIVKLRPAVIHTQTGLYKRHLKMIGFHSKHLSLFSNIPVAHEFFSKLKNTDLNYSAVSLVIFGSIYPNSLFKELASQAAEYKKENAVEMILNVIGRINEKHKQLAEIWTAAGLKINLLGEQTEASVSSIFSQQTIGIAFTPLPMIEKSGSATAMREHGLPVICISNPWYPKGYIKKTIRGIMQLNNSNFRECLEMKKTVPCFNKVEIIGREFTNHLLSACKTGQDFILNTSKS